VVTESERELLFRQLLDSNTRTVFLWVSRIYSNSSSSDVLSVELSDDEAKSFQTAYEQNVPENKVEALAQLTTDPKLREQRSPFFYGLTAFEKTYLGLERLLEDIIKPLNSRGKDLIGDLALVSLYSSEGFSTAEFNELCGFFHY